MMKHFFALLFLTIILSTSCSEDDGINVDERNETEILNYLETHNLEAQKSDSGLYYIVNQQGEGEYPKHTSDVKVSYKGYFTNGEVFDENAQGITFNLQQVITGWTEGITYFKKGGSGTLLIPSKLGYGKNGRSGIPGGSVLIFDIELLEIE